MDITLRKLSCIFEFAIATLIRSNTPVPEAETSLTEQKLKSREQIVVETQV